MDHPEFGKKETGGLVPTKLIDSSTPSNLIAF
jgi:hypothetical protein